MFSELMAASMPISYATRRPINLLLLVLVIAVINSAPGRAQNSPSLLGIPPGPTCDEELERQVAVRGLNLAYERSRPLSSATIPAFGFATEDMASAIDATVANYMNEWGLPGGAVAITHTDCDNSGACTNHLIFARSYGYMDVANGLFAEPDTRFRLASVSKAMTANAILTMVHDGMLTLDDEPFPLPELGTLIGGSSSGLYSPGLYNSQLSPITVDEMLHHAGGWNRGAPGAPDLEGYDVLGLFVPYNSAVAGSPSGPPACTELMSYVETQPLQVTPGTQTNYSNVGFCGLSEVIRETSGTSFFDYLSANVLIPLGMNDTRMALTPQSEQQDREAVYYDTTDPWEPSLFPPYAIVAPPYSSIGALEAQEGAGGILSTAIDVARFAASIASGQPANFPGGTAYPGWPEKFYSLNAELPSYESASGWNPENWPFGMGWDIAPSTCPVFPAPYEPPQPLHEYDNCNFIKDGGYQGSVSSVGVTADGYGFAAVFDGGDNTPPSPQSQIFWPNCNTASTTLSNGTVMPPAAASSANCALQAAYNHTAVEPWNVDFFPHFEQEYSGWSNQFAFAALLRDEAAQGFYPSRLEGRVETIPSFYPSRLEGRVETIPSGGTVFEYRGRFGPETGNAAPVYLYGQSCTQMLSAIAISQASTPLVSLHRFHLPGSSAYVYQAVWSPPVPRLP